MVDYKETLNLPKTDFPMKAGLSKREPEILALWSEIGLQEKLLEPDSRPTYVLHDGPPYANGDIHVGHTLNKVLKDIIVRHKQMTGFYAPYVPGWDCHGQPIEHQVEKSLGDKKKDVSLVELRRLCREYALRFVDRQREQFKRLGVQGDWGDPYLTLNPVYEAADVRVFSELYSRGLIYRGRKPIHWCYHCHTALAEAEIEYADEPSPSIYIRFPISTKTTALEQFEQPISLVVWTTTPWTLPANVAVAVHPDARYAVARSGEELLVVAADLMEDLASKLGIELSPLAYVKGSELKGAFCSRPLDPGSESVVVTADFVALDQGSGCVHIAPGHGAEDHAVGIANGLSAPMPVNDDGVFTSEAGKYEGLSVADADPVIIGDLQEARLLLLSERVSHSYPHCWRCKNPVIFRATQQWFVSMSQNSLREKALAAIESVNWVPEWSINRITGMVADRPDWCISRQRAWGVPIPVFYCAKCGEIAAGPEILSHVEELFTEKGADIWFLTEPEGLMPSGYKCKSCSAGKFTKETDILDVWFESGVSHEAVLKQRASLHWPADLYLEGSDQHRGWFQSSLLTSVGVNGKAPYKAVLTHGFLVDGVGRKMSKSLGNVIDPLVVCDKLGADILRLWVSSADYSSDIAVSDEILQRIVEAYRRLRNTFRFLLGNLSDFDPAVDAVIFDEMLPVDKWAMMRLQQMTAKALEAYESFRFYAVYQALYSFATVELSSFYLDILKDRLYASASKSHERRSAQSVLIEVLHNMVRLLAPVLVFTSEEVWQSARGFWDGRESVHLASMPSPNKDYIDISLDREWQRILAVRDIASKALEEARVDKHIGNSLEAALTLTLPDDDYAILTDHEAELAEIFIVSQVTLLKGESVIAEVEPADGKKCVRCWTYKTDVGIEPEHPEICGRCVKAVSAG